MKLNELLKGLGTLDGVEDVHVTVQVQPIVRKQATGERDYAYNPIRERVTTEDEIEDLVDETDWNYYGTFDVVNDYYDKDKLQKRFTVEDND